MSEERQDRTAATSERRTSLSAGYALYPELAEAGAPVIPIGAPVDLPLPYIVYRRTGFVQTAVKDGCGADTVTVEVQIFTAGHEEGLSLAEAVRARLDNRRGESGGLTVRSCLLSDSFEDYVPAGDAFVQVLIFNVKI